MVREHVDALVGCDRLNPLGCEAMLVCSGGTRDLRIRDVAQKQVYERVLRLADDRRTALAADKLLALERMQPFARSMCVDSSDGFERSQPEHTPEHCGVLDQLLFLGRQRIEPSGNDPLDGLRQLGRASALAEHSRELFRIERIPTGTREQGRLRLRVEQRPVEQRCEQPRRLVVAERTERDRLRVSFAAAPARPPLEQLGPRSRDDEQRHARGPLDEVIDEVEQVVVGPVEVLENQHRGTQLRERLGEPPPRREIVGPLARFTAGPDERAEALGQPAGVVGSESRYGLRELRPELVGRIALEYSRLRLHHFGEGRIRERFPVRQRAAVPPVRDRGVALSLGVQLCDEPALADAGNAHDRHQLRRLVVAHALVGAEQQLTLSCASDERRGRRAEVSADTRSRLHGVPHGHGLGLSLRLDGLAGAVLDRRAGRAECRLADEDPVRRRRRLQPRGGVHDVAGNHPFAGTGTSIERHERLTGVDADANLQLRLLQDRIPNRESRPHRPLRIVLVRRRRAEHRHHRVADELLHRASVMLERRPQPLVIRTQDRLHILRIQRLGPRREADEVREQDRDDLPLSPRARHALASSCASA